MPPEDWGNHRPGSPDATIDNLTVLFEDVYENPQYYVHSGTEPYEREAIQVLLRCKGKPHQRLTIYRALPPGYTEIRTGDWVATAEGYARQHAMQDDDPAHDWPVIKAEVEARQVFSGGNDILEWGYSGPTIQARQASLVQPRLAAQPGVYYHVTSLRDLPEIRANGLRPGADGKVWLWDNIGHAVHFADGWGNPEVPPVILVIRTDAVVEPTFWADAVTTTETVPVYDVIRKADFVHYADDVRRYREGSLKAEASETYAEHAMIALRPPEDVLKVIHDMDECTEEFEDLHLTLVYLGKIPDDTGDEGAKERLYRGLYDFALHAGYRGLTAKVNGFGTFSNPDGNALISLWDIPGIAEFRTRLLDYVKAHGYQPRQDDHGFTPHLTLAYEDDPVTTLPRLPDALPDEVHFTSVWLVWGEEWTEVTLS